MFYYLRRRAGHSVIKKDSSPSNTEKINSNVPSLQHRWGEGLIFCKGNSPLYKETQVRRRQCHRLSRYDALKHRWARLLPNMIERISSSPRPAWLGWQWYHAPQCQVLYLGQQAEVGWDAHKLPDPERPARREELPCQVRCARVHQPCASALLHC